MKTILSKTWTSCPSELSKIRKEISDVCKELRFPTEDINSIVLAIDEACTNIIRYGYKNCRDGEIFVEVLTENNEAIFRLHDHAQKVTSDCLKEKKSSPLEPGGLGIMLMRKIMNSVNFIHTAKCPGNILELKKDLPKESI